MGLDLIVYYRVKGEFTEDDVTNELAYGRKSWELVYALNLDDSDDYAEDQPIDFEQWHRLMNRIRPIAPYLDKISEAYENFYSNMETEEDLELIKLYEDWHSTVFWCEPQLGYEFSVGYIKSFWDADREVVRRMQDPNYEIWVCVSY